MKTPKSRVEYEKNKIHFNEYTMQKKKFSVAREIMIIIKPKKNWYEGITIKNLLENILENFKSKGYYKKKKLSKATIYDAVKDLNLYRDDIYIVSDCGINIKTSKKEYRYFCPYDDVDRSRNKEILIRNIFRNQLKNEQLDIFEEELQHEKEIVILKQSTKSFRK